MFTNNYQNYGYGQYGGASGIYPYTQNVGYAYQNQFAKQPLQPNMQTPIQQPIEDQPRTFKDIPIQSIKFLNKDEIKGHIVLANTKELLIDNKSNLAYIKCADGLGQSTTVAYKFEMIDEDSIDKDSKVPKIDTSNFVTKDDLKGFVTTTDIEKLNDEVEKLQKKIKINEILAEERKSQNKGE